MLPRRCRLASLAAMFIAAVHGFEPFAGIEELKPHRLAEFCGATDPKTGRAHCANSVRKTLDDGGDVAFDWHMEVNPKMILSLDTEGKEGVRIAKCLPGELELEFPEEYDEQVKEGNIVVASRFAHACRHLTDKTMLSRIGKLHSKTLRHGGNGQRVLHARLGTQRLEHIGEAAHSVSFNISYMPVEARDIVPFPERRTDLGDVQSRRLDSFDEELHEGNPETKSDMSGGLDKLGTFYKRTPKQLSNFGWNWDFYLNSTEEPEFNYSIPGINGYMKLKQPFITVHAGIFLNFTSKFAKGSFHPHVEWKAGILGHGQVSGRMMTDMRTVEAVAEDPFNLFHIPQLEKLRKTQWFGHLDAAAGVMPVTVMPGFNFKVEMFHKGNFEGTIQLGGSTHAEVYPELIFDSDQGLDSFFRAHLTDTKLYPPLWILETDDFEMGIEFEPTLWIKGELGHESAPKRRRLQQSTQPNGDFNFPNFGAAPSSPLSQYQAFGYQPPAVGATSQPEAEIDEKMGFELRPYINLTLKRDQGTTTGGDMHQFVAYPLRVIGLGTVDFQKRYIVQVEHNSKKLTSSPELNYGQVEVTDHMNTFDFGGTEKSAVLTMPLTVSIMETDATGTGAPTVLGTGTYTCSSLLNGQCSPGPAVVEVSTGETTAYVEMVVLWMENPGPWFASRIRGVDIQLSDVKLNQDAVEAAIPELKNGGTPTQDLYIRVTHGGRTYVTKVDGFSGYTTTNPTSLTDSTSISFGTIFIESFKSCGKAACSKGSIDMYYGSELVATSGLPQIPWSSVPNLVTETQGQQPKEKGGFMDMFKSADGSSSLMAGMANMMGTGLMAGTKPGDSIPLSISLMPKDPSATNAYSGFAFVHATANVVDPSMATGFLTPQTATQVVVGGSQTCLWTTGGASPTVTYTFQLTAYTLSATVESEPAQTVQLPSVGDRVLQPVPGGSEEIKAQCANNPVDGLETEDAPCSFQHLFNFDAAKFPAGSHVVLQVDWVDGSVTHMMQSPPIQIVAPSRLRRLQGLGLRRRLWTEEDWNSKLAAHADSCSKKDLHFKVGWGAIYRARMMDANQQHAGLMPMMGAMFPIMSTGFKRLGEDDMVNSDMENFLPKWLCSDGVCSGSLPGCRKANMQERDVGTVDFNFNRKFKFSDYGSAALTLKPMLAYAFSSLPEVLEIAIQELNASLTGGSDAPTPAPTTSLAWPALKRRLRSSADSAMERAGSVEGARVQLKFPKGFPLKMDRQLIDMMMKHGMFHEVHDDLSEQGHGPLFITDYEIIDTSEDHDEDNDGTSWQPSYLRPFASNAHLTFTVAALTGAAVLAAVASMVFADQRRRRFCSMPVEQEASQASLSQAGTRGPLE